LSSPYFYHRIKRTLRKDATLSFKGQYYEAPYSLAGHDVYLVFDPASNTTKWIESLDYQKIGEVAVLDKHANLQRHRQRPTLDDKIMPQNTSNLVDVLYQKRQKKFDVTQAITFNTKQEAF